MILYEIWLTDIRKYLGAYREDEARKIVSGLIAGHPGIWQELVVGPDTPENEWGDHNIEGAALIAWAATPDAGRAGEEGG